jgi:hypothetical protein
MRDKCENVNFLKRKNKEIKLGDKVIILKQKGYKEQKLVYPYEGIITEIIEEWDNRERGNMLEDWGFNMVTLSCGNTFLIGNNLELIEIIS